MAIASFSAYKAKQASPWNPFAFTKANINTIAGRPNTFWLAAPESGAAPTTAEVCTNNTKGALGTLAASQPAILDGTNVRPVGFSINTGLATLKGGTLVLCDRLSHQGGLDATAAGAQTTNLPTAALTRYTSGEGVWAGLEIYTQIGNTATTVSATYTNQAGTGGQVTPLTVWGSANFRDASRIILLPLAAGDTGVRAVASVTNTATTGTAGNFGVTLFKPLMWLPLSALNTVQVDPLLNGGANLPVIEDGACLMWMVIPPTTATGILAYTLSLAED